MENILKFNPKHHMPNDNDTIPQEFKIDVKHGCPKLEGLLLAKEGISNIESNISICKTCHAYLTFNKMPKLHWLIVYGLVLHQQFYKN